MLFKPPTCSILLWQTGLTHIFNSVVSVKNFIHSRLHRDEPMVTQRTSGVGDVYPTALDSVGLPFFIPTMLHGIPSGLSSTFPIMKTESEMVFFTYLLAGYMLWFFFPIFIQ